jgi:hypothetical protein
MVNNGLSYEDIYEYYGIPSSTLCDFHHRISKILPIINFELYKKKTKHLNGNYSVDSCTIDNKSNMRKILLGYDGNKKTNGTKLTIMVDNEGIMVYSMVEKANHHDSIYGYCMLDDFSKIISEKYVGIGNRIDRIYLYNGFQSKPILVLGKEMNWDLRINVKQRKDKKIGEIITKKSDS